MNTFFPQKTLIWWGTTCSGGLCDRLLGIVSTFCIAQCMGRHFLIKWDHAKPPQNIIDIDPKYDYYTYNMPFTEKIFNNYESQTFFNNRKHVDLWTEDHIIMWSNMNLFYNYCKERPEIKYLPRLQVAMRLLFTEILKVNIRISEKFSQATGLERAVGIHIRTVDKQFDNENEKEKQTSYIEAVLERCKPYIISDTVFIASDCDRAYSIAERVFDKKVVLYNEGPIIHSNISQEENGMTKVLLDLFSLGACKNLFIGWHTNFSRIGALLNMNRDFYCYDKENFPEKVSLLELSGYFSEPYWRT